MLHPYRDCASFKHHFFDADTIIVLDKGEIVEMGSHHELLQNNGHYAQFYRNRMSEQQNEGGYLYEKQ
ncbi:hypothetical protein GCM10020331_100540 [Ectobacillus funiculus]